MLNPCSEYQHQAPTPTTCTKHWSVGDVSQMSASASILLARATLDGDKFGYGHSPLVDGKQMETSCDQIAAFGVIDRVIRGTSILVNKGFSLGMIGNTGDEIEFKYWSAEKEKEYFVYGKFKGPNFNDEPTYKMANGGSLGSWVPGKELKLRLCETRPCDPCANSCTKLSFNGDNLDLLSIGRKCAANEERKCVVEVQNEIHECFNNDLASCYESCPCLLPSSPPPTPAPTPESCTCACNLASLQ